MLAIYIIVICRDHCGNSNKSTSTSQILSGYVFRYHAHSYSFNINVWMDNGHYGAVLVGNVEHRGVSGKH